MLKLSWPLWRRDPDSVIRTGIALSPEGKPVTAQPKKAKKNKNNNNTELKMRVVKMAD